MKKILVTGGAGFIGSHTCVELIEKGYQVIIFDNYSNSSSEIIDKIEEITKIRPSIICGDLINKEEIFDVFEKNNIDYVIHFAGLKAVGESVEKPLEYYHVNVTGTLFLLEAMKKYGCKNIVFSSSATVYGLNNPVPYVENSPLSATNPYGYTKVFIEQIINDFAKTDSEISAMILRYFNPIGAHKSGLIGENPKGIPNNLMPYITKVAIGELNQLQIFGNDYDTIDGTGVRDYIHVVDLACGHIKALEYVSQNKGVNAVNLGSGKGTSVLEIVNTFMQVNNIDIPYKIVQRRAGDVAECFADCKKAKEMLGFETKFTVEEMCKDSFNFIKN